jgi:hypothetical protein
MRSPVIESLKGGDRRSLGRANQVAAVAAKDTAVFRQLINALWHDDPVVRMRAADAAEKASKQRPKLLAPFKTELLALLSTATQPEVRWHLPLMVPRLPLTREERRRAISAFKNYLDDRSSIVRTHAMQGLVDLTHDDSAEVDPSTQADVVEVIVHLTKTGTAAMRARGRILLKRLQAV